MMLCLFYFLFSDISADYLQIFVHTRVHNNYRSEKALGGDISKRQHTATEKHFLTGGEEIKPKRPTTKRNNVHL